MSSVSILGCGESGQYWDGCGDSIGVNDCWNFGHPTDYLMVLDPPGRFTPDRRKIISSSKPKHFITDSKAWLRQFHNEVQVDKIKPARDYKELYCTNGDYAVIKYRFSPWRGRLLPNQISYWHTSPFPAMSLAYLLGYKEIVLWGVDFVTHKAWNPSKKDMLIAELAGYKELVNALNEVGVKVYLGHSGSMLGEFLEVKSCTDSLTREQIIAKAMLDLPDDLSKVVNKLKFVELPYDKPVSKDSIGPTFEGEFTFYMSFCTITPSRGDRPKFLEFCKEQLNRMTLKPDKSYFIDYQPTDDRKDLIPRIKKGIELAKADGFDKVFIVEDDDWYPPYYFELMEFDGDFVGCDRSLYYNLSNRTYEYLHHPAHPSLYCTGFRISALNDFDWKGINDQAVFLDLKLWRHAIRKHKRVTLHKDSVGVSIKHGIGVTGGSGHRRVLKHKDTLLQFLQSKVEPYDKKAFEFYASI